MKDEARIAPRLARKKGDADMLPPSYLAIFSVLFSIAAMFFNLRVLAWCAVFSLISSFSTRRSSEFDFIQSSISTAVTLSVLLVIYADPFAT
ncbi:hypothetical protein BASA81_008367 [Batrachochytrium salamandrivorans]|nr:hypothetical protein BASA81_008367 [Batrachochytrium salamandrivorans]